MIVTHTNETVNVGKKTRRAVYRLHRGSYKSACKLRFGLRARRVANGPLFNNATLTNTAEGSQGLHAPWGPALCKVGVKHRGAERSYTVPTVWRKDYRGNMRRYILRSAFDALPQLLQDIAISRGVSVSDGYVTFSRCVAAWAGHDVKGMHVHHVNMDTTDDRLCNLWVLTASEHSAIHSDKQDLLYDEEWYEYSSAWAGNLQLEAAVGLTEDDVAQPVEDEILAAYNSGPSFEETMASLHAMFRAAGVRIPAT